MGCAVGSDLVKHAGLKPGDHFVADLAGGRSIHGIFQDKPAAFLPRRIDKFTRGKAGSDSGEKVLDVRKEGASINVHYAPTIP